MSSTATQVAVPASLWTIFASVRFDGYKPGVAKTHAIDVLPFAERVVEVMQNTADEGAIMLEIEGARAAIYPDWQDYQGDDVMTMESAFYVGQATAWLLMRKDGAR